jgi:hypothetical protein
LVIDAAFRLPKCGRENDLHRSLEALKSQLLSISHQGGKGHQSSIV